MENLISEKDFEETLAYYLGKYTYLTEKRNATPAAACVILLSAVIDTALRVVFSEENETIQNLEERVSDLEGAAESNEEAENET
jgi:hypothetical protein